jgi:hypothetical protein
MFACGLDGHEQEFLDSLFVMEAGIRHFYTRAMAAKAIKAPAEVVDKNREKAVAIAAIRRALSPEFPAAALALFIP